MEIQRLSAAQVDGFGDPDGVALHLRGLVKGSESVRDEVQKIVADVKDRGDVALVEYTKKLDTGGKDPRPLLVPEETLDEALKKLDLDLVAGMQVAIANVAEVAQAAIGEDVSVELPQGQRIVMRELPVGSAAVYVPGGRAPYPSTVIMGVVTARAAGVVDVCVCSPPNKTGQIDPLVLGVCRLVGVERVYRIGGAQAIAALAYGSESVKRADVIVGPGNLYVQEAKRQLSAIVGIDGFAGPSDLTVVLGANVSTREVEVAALDMLAQAEHGEGSIVIGISPSLKALEKLAKALERLVSRFPSVMDSVCVLIHAADAPRGIDLANAIAPEHLQLIGEDVEGLSRSVRCAGCVFVGSAAGTAFGDYVAGSNHVLPTGGSARFASTLSPRHFRRRMAEVRLGPEAGDTVRKLAAAGIPLALAESFQVHAQSMAARVRDNSKR
jgi:histidinol dehydrogenase